MADEECGAKGRRGCPDTLPQVRVPLEVRRVGVGVPPLREEHGPHVVPEKAGPAHVPGTLLRVHDGVRPEDGAGDGPGRKVRGRSGRRTAEDRDVGRLRDADAPHALLDGGVVGRLGRVLRREPAPRDGDAPDAVREVVEPVGVRGGRPRVAALRDGHADDAGEEEAGVKVLRGGPLGAVPVPRVHGCDAVLQVGPHAWGGPWSRTVGGHRRRRTYGAPPRPPLVSGPEVLE